MPDQKPSKSYNSLPFVDLPKPPLLDLLPSVSLVGDDVLTPPLLDLLPSVSLVGDDVLTDSLSALGKSAALADLALVRVSDVGDDVPRLADFDFVAGGAPEVNGALFTK